MFLDVWMIFVLQNSLTMTMTCMQSNPHSFKCQCYVNKKFFLFCFFLLAKLNKIYIIIEISGNFIFQKSPEQDGEFALSAVRTMSKDSASLNQTTCECHGLNKHVVDINTQPTILLSGD